MNVWNSVIQSCILGLRLKHDQASFNVLLAMGTSDEINELFQKFVDKSISSKERQLFYSYLMDPDNIPQIRRLMSELWDYINMTVDDNLARKTSKLDQKGELLDNYISEMAKRFYEVETIIKKIIN